MCGGSTPGGCIPEWFVDDHGCSACRLEDPRVLGVILEGGEKGSCSPCLECVC